MEAAAPVPPPRVATAVSLSSNAQPGGRKRWRLRQSPFRDRLGHSGLPKLIGHVLENRGVGTLTDAQRFLGGKETRLGDARGLPGFEAALGVMREALRENRLVCVYGDFDVDGITSTAILSQALMALGGRVLPYIPHREREGYGLNLRAIDSLADRGVNVLVTCDCGTSSNLEIERAREYGIEVVVVDHHMPPALLPDANALVNPKLETDYGFIDYSTAGLAYRLAEALFAAQRRPFPEAQYVAMAALGTVADMVPLLGENREIVRRGLAALAETDRPGLRALIEVSGLQPKDVSSEAIAFNLAPRINAAGRLADARLALDLLMTDDEATALALATQIDALNRERQRMTREAQDMARGIVENRPEAPLTLVGHEGFHQGIIGLVASRLVETLGRPAIVYQRGEDESRGSCRSIPDFDITGALRSCSELFERFGGHHQAAGFTIRNDRLEAFEERLMAHAGAKLAGADLTPVLDVDAEWPLANLRSEEIRWMAKLQPTGMANPHVTLLSRDVTVVEARGVGADGTHLRLKLKNGPVIWPAIAFRYEGESPPEGSHVDLVYSLSSDRYGPTDQGGALQLTVVDIAPFA